MWKRPFEATGRPQHPYRWPANRDREREIPVDYDILGWPPDGPTLRLDYERFAYAGKFVMSNTGKAVARAPENDEIAAAVAFNEDRTDSATLWIRYVTVRDDCRGNGIGPQLIRRLRDRALECGYERLRIAVNNPFAFEALHRIGFQYRGETTGIAELVLEYPARAETDDLQARYRQGLAEFRDRELTDEENAFIETKHERGPPERLDR